MARFIEPSIEIDFYKLDKFKTVEEAIEDAARTCYKSKDKITPESASRMVRNLLKNGHHAMLEFGYARGKLVCNRGVTHELVRHRLYSFAQESTRYVDYTEDEDRAGIQFVIPPEIKEGLDLDYWMDAMRDDEVRYNDLRKRGYKPQIARGVLPIDVKTEIVVSGNLREWMHAFEMRCDKHAHPHIRRLMSEGLVRFAKEVPSMFELQAERMGV